MQVCHHFGKDLVRVPKVSLPPVELCGDGGMDLNEDNL